MSHHHQNDVEGDSRRPESRFVTWKDLVKVEKRIMATVSESIAAFAAQLQTYNDAEDAAITGLQGDVTNLNAQIAALQASPGALTAADQATLDGLQARGKTISDKLAALDALTPPVLPPVPNPVA
jgi:hypothetical protein